MFRVKKSRGIYVRYYAANERVLWHRWLLQECYVSSLARARQGPCLSVFCCCCLQEMLWEQWQCMCCVFRRRGYLRPTASIFNSRLRHTYTCAFACALWWSIPRQVLGHLGFDFEDDGVPLQQETGADGKRPPTNDNTPSRGKSQFLSWGGASSMSFQVGRSLLVAGSWSSSEDHIHDQSVFCADYIV